MGEVPVQAVLGVVGGHVGRHGGGCKGD
jgi:hypothetical protein